MAKNKSKSPNFFLKTSPMTRFDETNRTVLSSLFGTAGRIRINLEAAGRISKQRQKATEHYKLRECSDGQNSF